MRVLLWLTVCFLLSGPVSAQPAVDRGVAVQRNDLTIVVPEAFELANVLMFMTDWGQENDPKNYFDQTEYAAAVRDWFGPHRKHPIFAQLNSTDFDNFNNFIGMREGGYPYSFGPAGKLVKTDRYSHWWGAASAPWHFEKHLALIEDFAQVSRFREFYHWQRPFYAAQAAELLRIVDLERMNGWLESRFPTRYNSLTVVFSPLARGNHSASFKTRPDGRDLRIAIAGPYLADLPSLAGGDLSLTRQTFTEIDHGYVNPVSDRHEEAVAAAFSKAHVWRKDAAGFYGKPKLTFNEYMTWGVFLLYVGDHYLPERHAAARTEVIDYMEKRRGFIAFGEFYGALEKLYRDRAEHQNLADLYPGILSWAADRESKARS
jgi:hypothetical protein